MITLYPTPGEHVVRVARAASRIARERRCRVRFTFNGVKLDATPKKSPYTVVWEFHRIIGQLQSNYRLSRRGQEELRRRAAEIADKQSAIMALTQNLGWVLDNTNLDTLMDWLKQFVRFADDSGVRIRHEDVAIQFESRGYQENHHVGQPAEWFNTRERMGQYLIGEAINSLRRGLPPHPITLQFIDKYWEL